MWVGSNSTILRGVTVGDNAIIAAGSVVTKDVAANTVAGGDRQGIFETSTRTKSDSLWNPASYLERCSQRQRGCQAKTTFMQSFVGFVREERVFAHRPSERCVVQQVGLEHQQVAIGLELRTIVLFSIHTYVSIAPHSGRFRRREEGCICIPRLPLSSAKRAHRSDAGCGCL